MWNSGWRDQIWSRLDQPWDLIIVGGGITGAGIFREACRAGLKTLLLEQGDFASGTSSRSTKMVHGGLRYLKNAQVNVTYESVAERQRLLREGKGLIKRMGFLFTELKGDHTPGWMYGLGLIIYDIMAGQWAHQHYNAEDMRDLCPPLTTDALLGGYRYIDAQVDDARLTLRIIREAVEQGGSALNYARAEDVLRTRDGQVRGVVLRDVACPDQGRTAEVQAGLVISATGAWADELRMRLGKSPRIRPLRGSHLIFSSQRLALQRAISWAHPDDGRPLIAMPWEGVTLVGTTDIDHRASLESDPPISMAEAKYILAGLSFLCPDQELTLADVQATFSGIRPVVDTGKTDPSKESREYIIWKENGMITVSGGKMTTFRLMARDTLQAARPWLPPHRHFDPRQPVLDALPYTLESLLAANGLKLNARARLMGRYAAQTPQLLSAAFPGELTHIGFSDCLWAELRWAARSEGVVHLDDLLLRRVRLGLLLPNGGTHQMEQIREIVQPELGWDDSRWAEEVVSYTQLWNKSYCLPTK